MCRHNVKNFNLNSARQTWTEGVVQNVVSDECETTRAHDNHSHPSEWVKCEMRNEKNDREMMSKRWWCELNTELRKHWNSKYKTNDDELGICELYRITFFFLFGSDWTFSFHFSRFDSQCILGQLRLARRFFFCFCFFGFVGSGSHDDTRLSFHLSSFSARSFFSANTHENDKCSLIFYS